MISAIYGIPVIYSKDNWPNSAHKPLSDQEMKALVPPDLDNNLFFQRFSGTTGLDSERSGENHWFY
jgi:hypothetical protein